MCFGSLYVTQFKTVYLGFWIPPCGFQNRFLRVELGFRVLIVSRISDSLSLIPDSKAQEQAKKSRILESGTPYMW